MYSTAEFSVAGGAFDNRNTVECVFVQNPSGTLQGARDRPRWCVTASANPTIATPRQDCACRHDNADVPAAHHRRTSAAAIGRSGSMIARTGTIVDITRTSGKRFVDLMDTQRRSGRRLTSALKLLSRSFLAASGRRAGKCGSAGEGRREE